MTTSPQSGKDFMAKIQPTRREERVQLCLRPDLLEKHEAKTDELETLKAEHDAKKDSAGGQGRLGSSPPKKMKDIAAEIQAIEAEIEATAAWFTVRATDRPTWQAMCDRHPPREGFISDMYQGFNVDATLDDAVRECLIDPVFEDCAAANCDHSECGSWEWLMKLLNPSEWQELRDSANRVNSSVVEPPKSELASQILTRRVSGSGRPAATG